MTTKEDLVLTIKKWIEHDDNIKKLQQQIKQHRTEKNHLSSSLVQIMKTNEIDCFDIKDGKLIFCKNKVKTPINKKTLLNSLEKYFANIPGINAEDVNDFIFDNREIIIKENIKRNIKR